MEIIKNKTLLNEPANLNLNKTHECNENCDHKTEQKTEEFKNLKFETLSVELKNQLTSAVKDLIGIKENISKNSASINTKSFDIKNIIEELKKNSTIKINTEAFEEFNKGYTNYSALSHFYIEEIDFYIQHYTKYLDENHPTEIKVNKNSTMTFEEHIASVSRQLKLLAKKRKKDFAILFSRYDHSFNNQLKQLKSIDSYLKASPETTTEISK